MLYTGCPNMLYGEYYRFIQIKRVFFITDTTDVQYPVDRFQIYILIQQNVRFTVNITKILTRHLLHMG